MPEDFQQDQNQPPAINVPKKGNWFSPRMLIGIIFLLLVFAIIAAVAYQLVQPLCCQNPVLENERSQAVAWKTYSNNKFGYEIKYPADWTAKTIEIQDGSYVTLTSPDSRLKVSINYTGTYDNGVYDNATEEERALIKQILSTFKLVDQTDSSSWKTTRNEYYGFEVSHPQGWTAEALGTSINLTSPDKSISLSVGLYGDNNVYSPSKLSEEENFLIDRIVSSFKIIEPVYVDTTNWKTYYDQEFGYQISYPQTWMESHSGAYVTLTDQDKRLNVTINRLGTYNGEVYRNASPEERNVINQILSSFKIIVDSSTWKTYRNDKFGFELKYPPNWKLATVREGGKADPMFVVYDGDTIPENYYSNITQVAIFPFGLGTEGAVGETKKRIGNLTQEKERYSEDYNLSDGRTYGYFLRFMQKPTNWNEFGFIWANSAIDNIRVACGDQKKSMDECDSIVDGLLMSGSVDPEKILKIRQVLSTFRFIN